MRQFTHKWGVVYATITFDGYFHADYISPVGAHRRMRPFLQAEGYADPSLPYLCLILAIVVYPPAGGHGDPPLRIRQVVVFRSGWHVCHPYRLFQAKWMMRREWRLIVQ